LGIAKAHAYRNGRHQHIGAQLADTPFGGYGASGPGRRHRTDGWQEFVQAKTIAGPAPELVRTRWFPLEIEVGHD